MITRLPDNYQPVQLVEWSGWNGHLFVGKVVGHSSTGNPIVRAYSDDGTLQPVAVEVYNYRVVS